jgi:hypothetical protein
LALLAQRGPKNEPENKGQKADGPCPFRTSIPKNGKCHDKVLVFRGKSEPKKQFL